MKINQPKDLYAALFKHTSELIRQAAGIYAEELRAKVLNYIDSEKINVSGDLKKSITSAIDQEVQNLIIRVGSNLKYAVFVHEGTRPHWMPIKPLITWVNKKGIIGSYSIKTRKRLGSKSTIMHEDMAIAKAIQWKISREGTKSQPFLKLIFDQEKGRMMKRLTEIVTGLTR